MAAPLRRNSETVGAIAAFSARPGQFKFRDLETASRLAAQIEIGLRMLGLVRRLQGMADSVLRTFASAIEARDAFTGVHARHLEETAVAVAARLGLSEQEVDHVRQAVVLHDIGKIGVPDAILRKPGRLDAEEYAQIKRHPAIAAEILKHLDFLAPVVPLIYHHHERYDGKGYPDGLVGEQIPMGAAMVAVADAFEAMTGDRPYRQPVSNGEAVAELRRNAGTQFHPVVVDAFVEVVMQAPSPPAPSLFDR